MIIIAIRAIIRDMRASLLFRRPIGSVGFVIPIASFVLETVPLVTCVRILLISLIIRLIARRDSLWELQG